MVLIDLTGSDDEDAQLARAIAASLEEGPSPGAAPSDQPSHPPAGQQGGGSYDGDEDDEDDDMDLSFLRKPPSQPQIARPPAGQQGGAGPSRFVPAPGRDAAAAGRAMLTSSSSQQQQQQGGGSQPGGCASSAGRSSPAAAGWQQQQQPPEEWAGGEEEEEQEEEGGLQDVRRQYHLSDQDVVRPVGAAAQLPGPVLAKEEWQAEADAAGDEEAQRAEAEGCPDREVKRRRKKAVTAKLNQLKAAAKEHEKQLKLQAKAAKKAEAEQRKVSAKVNKEVNKALAGGPCDASKFISLRVSARMAEAPWFGTLTSKLAEEKFNYKLDVDMPLSGQYAMVRFVRHAPRAAAAALVAPLEEQGGQPSLEVAQVQKGEDPAQLELLFPLVCVFLPPADLIAACTPPRPPGYHLTQQQHQQQQQPAWAPLQVLRADLARAFPHCTLMLGCLGLSRALTAKEREQGSTFNSQVVREQLLELMFTAPELRMREDLLDGSAAAEWLVTTCKCLGKHHQKQQEGYLSMFNQSKVRGEVLEGVPAGARTLAVALGHLLPPRRAALLASRYPSLPHLLRVLNDDTKSPKDRLAALQCQAVGERAATIGKQSAQNVLEFFTQPNPDAACKDDVADS